ncbi:MAG: DNA helicase [Burkholderiaceae bacterium]
MKLSAPIYILKQQAKSLAEQDGIRLHAALDKIATREGFNAWSHLSSSWQQRDPTVVVYDQFSAGDLVLIGSRPGQGKTMLGLGLAIEAMSRGTRAAFFTLEYAEKDVAAQFAKLGKNIGEYKNLFLLDTSETICASQIAAQLDATPRHTLVIVDYLQLLDQRRNNPPLDDQVRELKQFAVAKQATVVLLSQINKNFDPNEKPCPDLSDLRLPNPVDVSLFDKACFLHDGKMQLVC